MALKKISNDTTYKPRHPSWARIHKPFPPFKAIAPNGLAKDNRPWAGNSWNKICRKNRRIKPCARDRRTPWHPAACAMPATSTSTSTTPGRRSATKDGKHTIQPEVPGHEKRLRIMCIRRASRSAFIPDRAARLAPVSKGSYGHE